MKFSRAVESSAPTLRPRSSPSVAFRAPRSLPHAPRVNGRRPRALARCAGARPARGRVRRRWSLSPECRYPGRVADAARTTAPLPYAAAHGSRAAYTAIVAPSRCRARRHRCSLYGRHADTSWIPAGSSRAISRSDAHACVPVCAAMSAVSPRRLASVHEATPLRTNFICPRTPTRQRHHTRVRFGAHAATPRTLVLSASASAVGTAGARSRARSMR